MDELVEREFTALRDLIKQHEQRRADLAELEREQRRADKVALDARLDSMNEFRSAMQDQQASFVQRNEFEEAKIQGIERYNINRNYVDQRLEAKFDPLNSKVDQLGKPNWHFLSAVASIAFAAIAGMWLIIGLKMESTVSPLALTVEQVRVVGAQNAERLRFVEAATNASTSADVASKTDRAQMEARIHQIEQESPSGKANSAEISNLKQQYLMMTDRLQDLRARETAQNAALIEIETQFCNGDYMRNLMHAFDLRVISMLWAKSFPDSHFPTDNAYYPKIGKCGGETSASN